MIDSNSRKRYTLMSETSDMSCQIGRNRECSGGERGLTTQSEVVYGKYKRCRETCESGS